MKPWAAPVRWRGTAALSAFAGGKFKAGEEVGQNRDWSVGFLPGLRQHPSIPQWGPLSLGFLAKCSLTVKRAS